MPFYGVYDFLVRYEQHPNRDVLERFFRDRVMHETAEQNPALWDLASPVAQVHEAAPPFMVLHGTHDSLVRVEDARHFVEQLKSVSRNPVLYAELPGAQHAFEIFHSLRTSTVVQAVDRFLTWVHSGYHAEAEGSQPAS